MFKIGCAEQILDVELFAELYGYGPFAGRRNMGIHDPLYCRAYSFHDGNTRGMIIYTDVCTTPDEYAREMRSKISLLCKIPPEHIAFVATHTHSAPVLGYHSGIGFGAPDVPFQETWKRAVIQAAKEAFLQEEEIAFAEAGKTFLPEKLGVNRIDKEKNITDESIRYIRFMKKDGTCKLLLHNHGIHGIAMNGDFARLVSADWMGAVNTLIREQKLAQMPLFLQGPCGDVNTVTACSMLKNDTAGMVIAEKYVAFLKKAIEEDPGEKITDLSISGLLSTFKFPVKEISLEEMKKEALLFQEFAPQHALRMKEMILLKEKGYDLNTYHDLQVIKIGPFSFFFIPGEYFVEDGKLLMERSGNSFAFVSEVANGDGKYFPSEEDMKRYPDVASFHTCKNTCAFGFYEIYGYPGAHRYKYQDHIASFIADNLIQMEKTLC